MTSDTEGADSKRTAGSDAGQGPVDDQDAEPTTMAPAGEAPTDPGPIKEAREQQGDEPGTH